jgi:hypothetical protein
MRTYDLLFADQDLDEVILDSDFPDGSPLGVARARMWEGLHRDASTLAGQAQQGIYSSLLVSAARQHGGLGAKRTLQTLAEDPQEDTRARLWAFNALRKMGERPSPLYASEPLGFVIEVPVDGAADVMAAYADGRTRMMGHAGNLIIREPEDPPSPSVLDLVGKASALMSIPPAPREPIDLGVIRMSALSALGIHKIDLGWKDVDPPSQWADLFQAAVKVLEEITAG